LRKNCLVCINFFKEKHRIVFIRKNEPIARKF
jgi:hypothetical protein